MASRIEPFAIGEYYHVFNRGVAKQNIFSTKLDYNQAILTLDYYQYFSLPMKLSRYKKLTYARKRELQSNFKNSYSKLVQIICFVMMPNHFHFLLKQLTSDGISSFIGNFCNSYTRYYNTRHSRIGHIFQGAFKSVHVGSHEQLIHLSRYIHLNPYASSIVRKDQLPSYPWSSYPDYLEGKSDVLELEPILSNFGSADTYQNFVLNHADYARELEIVKHLIFDVDG